jgi:hypothetical protein
MVRVDEGFCTVGSGKLLLDEPIQSLHDSISSELPRVMEGIKLPTYFFPYFYCLWLMERVQGFEVSQLKEQGVGGYFYFIGQHKEDDYCQFPAVYVLNDKDTQRNSIHHYVYRVAVVRGVPFIDCPIRNERMVLIDNTALDAEGITGCERMKFEKEIVDEESTYPYYVFCGFGYAEPIRPSLMCHIGTRKPEVGPGWIHPRWAPLIDLGFRSYLGNQLPKPIWAGWAERRRKTLKGL